jgi:phosphoribosylaminoimidazole (AIR) synthetase
LRGQRVHPAGRRDGGDAGCLHNGYSLLRKLFAWIPMDVSPPGFDRPLGDVLLEPHRNYLPVLEGAVATGAVKAMAHITGGGLIENVPRVLPGDVDAVIRLGAWPVSPLFRLVRELATALDDYELHRTLNMGVGMVVICSPSDVERVQAVIDEESWVIGELVPRDPTGHRVRLSPP